MKCFCQLKFVLGLILYFSCINALSAQNDSDLVNSYKDYIEAPREIVYAHLNKSTYIKGESIGFTAYVLDKKDRSLSLPTTNLYVTITNSDDKVIKQKLIKVEDGIAANSFVIDSLFSSGTYHFKAYTNWMRNFNEHNYYSESIKIIDPKTEAYIENSIVENSIDAQFLPESGHLLHGVENTVGVVIKDSQGFGIPNANGEVLDKDNQTLTSFKTNQFGIAKFPLIAESNSNYRVAIDYANKKDIFPLGQTVEKTGIILSVKRLKTKLYVSVVTNDTTLDAIKNKRFTLMVHNGNAYDILDIYFTDSTVVTKVIDYNSIPAGINILTLFNDIDMPVAERLFFNYEGIDIVTSNTISTEKTYDSLSIDLGYRNINPQSFNSISISVLPEATTSYNRHNNIASHIYLQPYIKGPIEFGQYYFQNIDEKKRYELDNLLLTQGWSSYDWSTMFLPENLPYAFEQGLFLKANINNQKFTEDTYVLHHFGNSQPIYKKATDGNTSFIFENVFPTENDRVLISRFKNEKEMVPAQLYIQSTPNTIPNIKLSSKPLPPKSQYTIAENLNTVPFYEDNTYNL
ncbi:MAG: hypothetical protein HKN40_06685, partial [Winogradskyella sp.]|uniref:hypothetical protein n=1 Tax=Winogradskyella sp. TaxID=1883156 RepID=UPI0017CA8621|nr:hypothetical protein [Winogradskyella sp.]